MAIDTKILCLGVLSDGDRTGYEIKRYVETRFRHFFAAGYGSIYPALAELARDGAVTVSAIEGGKRPDKKVYSLTRRGRERLCCALASTEPRHKVRSEFLTLLFFAHLAPAERVEPLIAAMCEQWRDGLLADIAAIEQAAEAGGPPLRPGQEFCAGFARAILGAAMAYCEAHGPVLAQRLAATEAGPVGGPDADTHAYDPTIDGAGLAAAGMTPARSALGGALGD